MVMLVVKQATTNNGLPGLRTSQTKSSSTFGYTYNYTTTTFCLEEKSLLHGHQLILQRKHTFNVGEVFFISHFQPHDQSSQLPPTLGILTSPRRSLISVAARSVCLSAVHLLTRYAPTESTQQSSHLSGPQSANPAQPKHQPAPIYLQHEPSGTLSPIPVPQKQRLSGLSPQWKRHL
ncbi:hypothetical protein Tco_0629875 [Tanacetum coccineum]|uniref:Uncharacterized protein n=1 Tax=Tanacetum coccineum TaxID=301880 RepID=A0ABQ4WUP1_9ASTR